MKTLVYELSNCSASAWGTEAATAVSASATLRCRYYCQTILLFLFFLFFGSIVKGPKRKEKRKKKLKTIPISRFSLFTLLHMRGLRRQLRKYTLFCAAHTCTHRSPNGKRDRATRIQCIFTCQNGHSQLYSHSPGIDVRSNCVPAD